MPRLIKVGETDLARRRLYFDLRDDATGLVPVTNQAGATPEVSRNGGAFTTNNVGPLVHTGNGRYYAEISTTLVLAVGDYLSGRYAAAGVADTPSRFDLEVVDFDPLRVPEAVDNRLTAQHGGGSWRQTIIAAGSALGAGAVPVNADLSVGAGETFELTFNAPAFDSTGWTAFVFTVKADADGESDDAALIIARVTNPASAGTDGILRWKGATVPAASPTRTLGAVSVDDDSPDTEVTVTLSAAAMDLPPTPDGGGYKWELNRWIGTARKRMGTGAFNIERTVHRNPAAP